MFARCSRIEAAAAIWRGRRGKEPSSVHVGASNIEPRLWSFSTRQYADEKVCSQIRRWTTRLSMLDSSWRAVSAQLPCPEVIGRFHFQPISPFKWGWWDKGMFLLSSTHVIGIIQRPDLMLGQNILRGRLPNLSFVRLFCFSCFLFNSLCEQLPPLHPHMPIFHHILCFWAIENDLLCVSPPNQLFSCGSLFLC